MRPVRPSLMHDWLLTGPILRRPSADSLYRCAILTAIRRVISQPSLPCFPVLRLFLSLLPRDSLSALNVLFEAGHSPSPSLNSLSSLSSLSRLNLHSPWLRLRAAFVYEHKQEHVEGSVWLDQCSWTTVVSFSLAQPQPWVLTGFTVTSMNSLMERASNSIRELIFRHKEERIMLRLM